MPGPQVLPLRPFEVTSAPFHRRAIAFSGDAELVVAADDSIHVIPPQFPHTGLEGPSSVNDEKRGSMSESAADDISCDSDDADEEDAHDEDLDGSKPRGSKRGGAPDMRRQYMHGTRQIPVSSPLHVEINRHLYAAAGLTYPYDLVTMLTTEIDEGTGEPRIFGKPVGAGSATINATGGTMNSVVDVQWSPCGLGRNRRSVLGVLTTAGVLTVFGESPSRPAKGVRPGYDYSDWRIMWAVGERFIVPPQNAYGEHISSFAWAPELFTGFAIIAAKTDQGEVIILAVRRVTIPGDGKKVKEDATWHVREIARFLALGPHPKGSFMERGFVPCGTGYGLRWGPWLTVGDKRTSVVAYVARNHVGFRKITVDAPADADSIPNIEIDSEDLSGFCTFLSADSFVEWEDTIHSVGERHICRGILATPFVVRVFEVDLTSPHSVIEKHSVDQCGTMYPTAKEQSHNPIMGAIIHPQETPDYKIPVLYTAVRMSATHTNPGWYETNRPPTDAEPQWHQEIHEKVNISMPEYMFNNGSEPDSDIEPDSDTEAVNSSQVFRAGGVREVHEISVPEIFLHNARLWGLTVSPGGGVTAVLVSYHQAQGLEHGGFHSTRSRVAFGFIPHAANLKARRRVANGSVLDNVKGPDSSRPLSTEARVWEWMYGGGAGVKGVSGANTGAVRETDDDVVRSGVRGLFAGALERQACTYCKTGLQLAPDGAIVCKGQRWQHEFDACGASGLAILEPNVSRSCGVCGKETLKLKELRKYLPEDKASQIPDDITGGACGCCGGKFVD